MKIGQALENVMKEEIQSQKKINLIIKDGKTIMDNGSLTSRYLDST